MQSTMSSVASLTRASTVPRARVARRTKSPPCAVVCRAGPSEGSQLDRDASSSSETSSWKKALASSLAVAVVAPLVNLGPAAMPAAAMYNKDLDVPINDPAQALAVVFGVQDSIKNVQDQLVDWKDSCPAPVFPCDLSQALTKTSTRVSGPLARSLPTLSDAYGADPYAVQDIIQSVTTTEAMLKANNARVKVNFDDPVEYLDLVNRSINDLLNDLSPDAVEAGRKRYDSCDLSVPPEAAGELECRLARAVSSGARSGGIS